MKSNTQNKQTGTQGENLACKWLESKGFQILMRNYYARCFGEIDIIALHTDVLHFIEVKTFKHSNPIYAITPKKLARIYQSIDVFFAEYAQNKQSRESKTRKQNQKAKAIATLLDSGMDLGVYAYCVDALLIWGEKIEFIPNISHMG